MATEDTKAADERKQAAEERRAAKAAEDAVTAERQARGYHTAFGDGQVKYVSEHGDGFQTFSEAAMLDHLHELGK
ncbi:MAG: hypothetical protein LC793_12295 [Thermomicrobia bacterium]|nr:hypothetical protein [Thermomicrobia bacterium]MCA1722650.1 hypothetical protein [Thermomicrobia bacterium]